MPIGDNSRTPALVAAGILGLSLALAGCTGTAVTGLGCSGGAGEAGPSPACTHMPTMPPGAISREAAIAAALRVVPTGGANRVIWANFERYPFADGTASPGARVCMIRIEGVAATPACPSGMLDRQARAGDPICLDTSAGVDVVLDIATGALLGWAH